MEIGLWIISLLIHKDQETSDVGTRYEKHNREQDSEARNEAQDLAFRKTNRKPGCARLGPWERGERGPLWDPKSSISGNSKVIFLPLRLRKGGGWSVEPKWTFDRRKLFRGNDLSFFGEKGIFLNVLLKFLFPSEVSTNKNNHQFSNGLVVHCGGGNLAGCPSMTLPGLWSFSLIWRENLSPQGENGGRRRSPEMTTDCPALRAMQWMKDGGDLTWGKELEGDTLGLYEGATWKESAFWSFFQEDIRAKMF